MLEADPEGAQFHSCKRHDGGCDRKQGDAGRVSPIRCNLSEIADDSTRFIEPAEMVVLKTCPMGANGFFNFSAANLWHRTITQRAMATIVEVSDRLPWLHGFENGVHVSVVAGIIDGEPRPAQVGVPDTDRCRPCRGEPDRRRDRGRRLPAGRHRRHSQRGMFDADAQRRAQSGRAHRNAYRRQHRPAPSGIRHGIGQTARAGQGRVPLRARFPGRCTRPSAATWTSCAAR